MVPPRNNSARLHRPWRAGSEYAIGANGANFAPGIRLTRFGEDAETGNGVTAILEQFPTFDGTRPVLFESYASALVT
jgi:hypothetical protein